MAQHVFPLAASSLPFRPFEKAHTKRTHPRGYMVNGVHIPNYIQLEVTLDVVEYNPRVCQSCWRDIAIGEIVGREMLGAGVHCCDCINVPDGIKVWHVSWPIARRTRRNPDGRRHMTLVCTADHLNAYVTELRKATLREVEFHEVTHAH